MRLTFYLWVMEGNYKNKGGYGRAAINRVSPVTEELSKNVRVR